MEPLAGRKGSNVITVRPALEWIPILRSAEVDLPAYDGALCSEVAEPFAEAVRRIDGGLDTYRALAPAGDKGDADFNSVVELLRWAAERCANRPAASLRVRIRDARG